MHASPACTPGWDQAMDASPSIEEAVQRNGDVHAWSIQEAVGGTESFVVAFSSTQNTPFQYICLGKIR